MFSADPSRLVRVRFGLNISFHILFSGIAIGLAWVLLCLRARIARGAASWASNAACG